MRRLLISASIAAAALAAPAAHAVPSFGIEILEDGNIVASFPLTAANSTATKSFTDALFELVDVSVIGSPLTPDPSFQMVATVDLASGFTGSHTLTLRSTETDLTGGGFVGLANAFTYSAITQPGSTTTATEKNFIDASDSAYAETTLIATTPQQVGSPIYTSPIFNYSPVPLSLFSETEEVDFSFNGPADAQTSNQIIGTDTVPEPVSLWILASGLLGLGVIRLHRR
jgi:hypothetical protein